MVEAKSDPGSGAPDVDFVALPMGTKIGRYEVLAVLGQGGFGITYRARDAQLNREVAIKEYLPTSLAIRQDGATVLPRSAMAVDDFVWGRDRFVEEGRTLATLHRAPGIVRVFDFLEINGTAYIVMEMLHGDTLDRHLKKAGRLGADAVNRILWTVLDGLEQVHATGFLHRDIKPANILIDKQGNPTLIDFGASRAAMAGRTATMTAVFTPGYAAPEQMSSARQGPWTDIYGLSATLYHAATGKPPPSAVDRMLDDPCEPIASLAGPDFPPGLLTGLGAGLAVRAADRPQSIAAWRKILSTIDLDATVVSRPRTVSPPSSAPAARAPVVRNGRAGLYAAAVAVAVLLAGGGYVALTSRPAPQIVSLQDMRLEDLERLVAERRAADAAAIEKRRIEEEARRKAESDAEAKRQADANLERAQQEVRRAEEELSRLRVEIAARRQEEQSQADAGARRAEADAVQRRAETEVAVLKQAEQEARKKAVAEGEATRRADEVLARAQAERQRADAKVHTVAATMPASPVGVPAGGTDAFDGTYVGTYDQMGARPGDHGPRGLSIRIAGQSGAGSLRHPSCGTSPVSVRLTPAGDVTGEAMAFDMACQRLPMTIRGRVGGGRLQVQLAGIGFGGAATLALPGVGPVAAAVPVAKPAPSLAAVAPAPAPTENVRWIGRVKCGTWPGNGMPLDLASTGGQATGGPRGGAFTMTISGTQYFATVKWTTADSLKSFSGSFSGTISGERISTTTIARADFKNTMGSYDDQCVLDLSRAI